MKGTAGKLTPILLWLLVCACNPRFVVYQPEALRNACPVTVVPISVNASEGEYRAAYFPRFREEFKRQLSASVSIKEAANLDRNLTWEDAVAAGKDLGVQAVVGLLIEDSNHPPRLTEILKIVKVSNGRALAESIRLITPGADYRFEKEVEAIKRLLSCPSKPGP